VITEASIRFRSCFRELSCALLQPFAERHAMFHRRLPGASFYAATPEAMPAFAADADGRLHAAAADTLFADDIGGLIRFRFSRRWFRFSFFAEISCIDRFSSYFFIVIYIASFHIFSSSPEPASSYLIFLHWHFFSRRIRFNISFLIFTYFSYLRIISPFSAYFFLSLFFRVFDFHSHLLIEYFHWSLSLIDISSFFH